MDVAARNILRPAVADILAAGTWILAVLVRIWAAWAERCITNADSSAVALMGDHMAALKDFPVFFYGQAYMGSLEPLASAAMVRLLGSTGFAVNLGPVVFAGAALFVLWRWARDAAGPWGGLAALLAGIFGPAVYFQFQTAPRGGYMVALFVDALVLLIASRLAADLRERQQVSLWRWGMLGLVAGAGMWSNMIVAAGLLAAILLLALGMSWRFWRHFRELGAGGIGFIVGFMPWLAWNVRHGWGSLEMSQFGRRAPPWDSLLNSWTRFLWLQDAGMPAFQPSPALMALALLGLAALGTWAAWRQWRNSPPRENYARIGAIIFCTMFMAVYVAAGINTTRTARYWVPLVPGLAVLAGVACAVPGGRVRRILGWLVLLALTVVQGVLCVGAIRFQAAGVEPHTAAYRELGAALERSGADALLAPIQLYPLNFVLGERIPVSNGKQKYYEPILRQAELADHPAYASDYNGVETFVKLQGGTCERIPAGGRHILWDVRRPAGALREISADQVVAVQDNGSMDRKAVLADRNVATWWTPASGRKINTPAVLEWSFSEPQDIRALRLVFAHGMADPEFGFPRWIGLEARMAGEWNIIQREMPTIPLEWSGPRVYPQSGLARLELPVVVKAATGLRVSFQVDSSDRDAWRLAEASVYAPGEDAGPGLDLSALALLGERLSKEPVESVIYAPRWTSDQLLCRNWIAEDRLAGLSAWIFPSKSIPRDGTVPPISFIVVVEPQHAAATRDALRSQHFNFNDEPAGPWRIFNVPITPGLQAEDQRLALRWTGDELLMDPLPAQDKPPSGP